MNLHLKQRGMDVLKVHLISRKWKLPGFLLEEEVRIDCEALLR